jgi:hypothetical protein
MEKDDLLRIAAYVMIAVAPLLLIAILALLIHGWPHEHTDGYSDIARFVLI